MTKTSGSCHHLPKQWSLVTIPGPSLRKLWLRVMVVCICVHVCGWEYLRVRQPPSCGFSFSSLSPFIYSFFIFIQYMLLVAKLCLTLCNPMDCNPPPGFTVHEILQARTLEWVVVPFSRGFSWPGGWTWVFCITGRFFTIWATKEAHWVHINQYFFILFIQQTFIECFLLTRNFDEVCAKNLRE